MFDRTLYKERAQEQLDGKWIPALCVIYSNAILSYIINKLSIIDISLSFGGYIIAVEPISIVLGAILIMATVFFFLQLTKNKNQVNFSTFLEGFSLWLKGILGILWASFWSILWSLLFFIPGIIKAFAYSQILFILAENPNTSVRKAMKMSKEMTKGYKGDIFFMHLSFIGWYILAYVPSCVIRLFITGSFLPKEGSTELWSIILTVFLSMCIVPYQYTSTVYAYYDLKQFALDKKVLRPIDFGDTESSQQ